MMRAFPGIVVWSAEHSRVVRSAGEGEHRNWFTYPHSARLQVILPDLDVFTTVMLGKDQIGLHPWNSLTRINQQFRQPLGRQFAIFIELFPARFIIGLVPISHGITVGLAD